MFSSVQLTEGSIYTRNDLRHIFSIKDATLNNGVFKPSGYQSIWLFITEKKTNDKPQFKDLLEGDTLYWDGQSKGRTDKLIIEHAVNNLELLVFYRKQQNEFPEAGFKYEGRFCYINHTGSQPAHFIFQRLDSFFATVQKDLEALQIEESEKISYREGKLVSKLINKHERNPKLRAATIELHGTRCQICSFSFAETYGIHGEGFIEVHHLYPVSEYTGEVDVDPSKDMAVICANCHRMIHRNPDKPLRIEELRQLVVANRKHQLE